MNTLEPIDIHGVCTWTNADTEETLAKHGLKELFQEFGIGANAQDLFGEVPKTHVHVGDVVLAGDALLNADGHGVFVIEGSLRVQGSLTFFAHDAYTVLVVKGDLEAENFQQAHDTQLVVFGKANIRGLLRIDVSDAGFALFRGPVSSRDRIVVDNDMEYAVPMFAEEPTGQLREKHGWSKDVVSRIGEYPDAPKIHRVLVEKVALF